MMDADELRERTTRVVGYERHLAQLEPLEQLGDEACESGRGQVGVGRHRRWVRAERELWDDATHVLGKRWHHALPHAPIDQEPVDQDGRRTRAYLAVFDRALGDLDLRHLDHLAVVLRTDCMHLHIQTVWMSS